jgi:hypothetical protein
VPRSDIQEVYTASQDAQKRLFMMKGQLEKLQSDQAHLQKHVDLLRRVVQVTSELSPEDLFNDLSSVSSLLENKLKEEQAARGDSVPPAPENKTVESKPALPVPKTEDVSPGTTVKPADRAPAADAEPAPATPPADKAGDAAQAEQSPDESPDPEIQAPDPAEPGTISYSVPVAQAAEGVSPQAAGAAMLIAWRDQEDLDVQALKNGQGHWSSYQPGLKASGPEFFATSGMGDLEPAPLEAGRLKVLLESHGQLWLQNPSTESDVRVLAGLSTDATSGTARVTFADPTPGGADALQESSISALSDHLGGGPVRIAHLVESTGENQVAEDVRDEQQAE